LSTIEGHKNGELNEEKGVVGQRELGGEINHVKSKIFMHFFKGNISFIPLETILTIPRELEHLKGW